MASFGESLRRERELRDISLREIADATKINLRYLEALEQNHFDILPGGVFNKGFIRAYARFIGADGESLVDLYLQETTPREAGAPAAAGNSAGLLRLAEPPARRADPAAAPAAPTGAVKPMTPVPFPAAGSPGAAPPAAQPIAAPRTAPAPRPVAPLRIATAPAHHEPLTERAAALAAITNPNLAAQMAPRRRPGITLGVALAAGGVVLAGGIAILITRGLGAGDRARPRPEATAGAASSPDAAPTDAAAPLDASLAPSGDSAAAASIAAPEGMTTASTGSIGATPDGAPAEAKPPWLAAAAAPSPAAAAPTHPRTTPVGPPPTSHAGVPAASVPSPVPVPAPAAEPARAPVPPGMEFRIEASNQVWVQVSCDGEDRVNRMLQAGEGASLRCLSAVKVSVTDGGAVRLMVDGARCVTPGENGYEMKGFVIRAENAAAICPPAAGGLNGRR